MPRRWLAMAAVLAAAAMLAACTSESTTAPAGSPAPAPTASPHASATATPAPAPSPSPSAAPVDTGQFASLGLTIDADTRWGDLFETFTAAEQACFRDEFGAGLEKALAAQPMGEGYTEDWEVTAFDCLAPETARAVFLDVLLAGMAADDVELGAAELACVRQTAADADIAGVIAAERDGAPAFFEFQGALLTCMPEVFLEIFLLNTGLNAAELGTDERACLLEAWDAGDWVALSTGDEVAGVTFALDLYGCVPAFYLSGMLGEEVTLSEADTACLRAAFGNLDAAALISVYEGRANAAGAVFGEVMSCVPDRILLHVFGAELGRELGEAEAACLRESFAGLDWSGLRVVDPDAVIAAEMVRCVPDLLLLAMLEQAGAGLEGVSEDELACMRAWAAEVDAGEQLLALAAGGDIVELGAGFFACAPHLLVSMADSALAGGGDDATPVAVGTSVDAVLDAADLAAVFAFEAERGVLYQIDVAPATLTAPASHVAAPPGSATITVEDDDAPAPSGLRYDTYDSTGEVTVPGSYAFLEGGGGATPLAVVTTYEGIREEATLLRVHLRDAGGVSRAGSYRNVKVGDLIEWRRADDCFTRYTVTSAPAPGAGAMHREFGVEWMTYAFTGCSGAVSAATSASVTSGDLPDLGERSLAAPVMHSIYQLVPLDWGGEIKHWVHRRLPKGQLSPLSSMANPAPEMVRQLPYWRDPDLPEGWRLVHVSTGYDTDPALGYTASYAPPGGLVGLEVVGYFPTMIGDSGEAATPAPAGVLETRVIDGRPAIVDYSPPGEGHRETYTTIVWIYDPATDAAYQIVGYAAAVRDIGVLIEIALSLFEGSATVTVEDDDPLPSTTLRYDTYDLTGAVTSPGSYAFLSGESGTTAVTTYEGLRDGTTTRLLIHTTDAGGTSRAAYYDTVQAGDLFDWKQTDDCWVRFRVTSVPAEAPGTTSELGVTWLAYTYTGCRGTIDADRAYRIGWTPPVIASRSTGSRAVTLITSPTRFGPFLLFREGDRDELEQFVELWPERPEPVSGSAADPPEWPSRDPEEVRRHPLWREPVLPAGWVLTGHQAHDLGWFSVFAVNETDDYGLEVHVVWSEYGPRRESVSANLPGLNISEARMIDGHPAVLWYDPTGTLDVPVNLVRIFDDATGILYSVGGYTGVDIDTLITVALSFLRGSAE